MAEIENASLSLFHPLVARWFRESVGEPTAVQEQAWPRIAAGEHLLVTAPTGSGKTLAACLWALNQFVTGRWPAGLTRVLYISPLRALNTDIQRNLLGPLDELRSIFGREGEPFPVIRVLTRSGDTPAADRRQMLRHPPEILISTPESLNLLLSSSGGRSLLTSLATVILDEIHAVFPTKRGTYLITAVDRLVGLSGEFQRILLSATIEPAAEVAAFGAGFRTIRESGGLRYEPRPISVISSDVRKRYRLRVSFVQGINDGKDRSIWEPIAKELRRIISGNRSTLIFVNSRRLCEMLTLMINQAGGEAGEGPIAYSHHGSLSLEIRAEVERKLKEGSLAAIVATHSLELGIDIGSLDEVVLVQSPFSISSAIQRVGRSGHRVNEVSRGTFFPTHPKDLLEAAVLAPLVMKHEIAPARAVRSPLDVLAQVIVSMVGAETWEVDQLYDTIRASHPYRFLGREQFDLVLSMLAGRYQESRIRELRPLVSIDSIDGTVRGRRGALQTLYLSGGVIPDRGYFHLRHQATSARIGDLDEEFVWEARVGDTFTFGAQTWRIHQITHNDVLVLPGSAKAASAPFWKGEENGRDFHFSERIGTFLEEVDPRLDDPDLAARLQSGNGLEKGAAEKLIDFLKRQKEATGTPLPHRHHLLVEMISAGPGGTPQAVLHTVWGGRVNRPLAMAMEAAWVRRFGVRPEIFVSNDCIVFQLPHDISADELLSLVASDQVEDLLRSRLEGSGYFGARFRECAGRALLLPRGGFTQRVPLWLSRLRSQKLLESVLDYTDFPILLETWRTCLQDEFDLGSLRHLLSELESGRIAQSEVHGDHPSPFAQGDWWRQVNEYMYMDDTPRTDKRSKLREGLLREVVFDPGLRPTVPSELVERFEAKRKRLSPGYAPQTGRELLDWVSERVAIPRGEWRQLEAAMRRDHGLDAETFKELWDRFGQFEPEAAAEPLISTVELIPDVIGSFFGPDQTVSVRSPWDGTTEIISGREREDVPSLLGQWLQFYGPVSMSFIKESLGIEPERLRLMLEDLIDSQKLIQGRLTRDGGPDEVCDSENFETLLRLSRRESIPSFEPLGAEWLAPLLAHYHGLSKPGNDVNSLYHCLEQLLGYPAEASAWESDILPARLNPYDPSWLDSLMQEGDLLWIGAEGHRITFCFETDLDLLREEPGKEKILNDFGGSFPVDWLESIKTGPADEETLKRLWEGVWQGRITNDTFLPLRRFIMSRFRLSEPEGRTRRLRHRRSRHEAQKEGKRPTSMVGTMGRWRMVPEPEIPGDLIEAEEQRKDRVRLLLERYGILFRELLQRELPAFRWQAVFRALRIMELSGEVLSGVFFNGIPGPQFISQQAFRTLQRGSLDDRVFWINAADPASVCGIGLDSLRAAVPPRLSSTHLVYRGKDLVLVSKRNGEDLLIHAGPDDPRLQEYFISLFHLLHRKFQPLKRIVIETINEEEAPRSPYVPGFRLSFDVSVEPRQVTLYRKAGY